MALGCNVSAYIICVILLANCIAIRNAFEIQRIQLSMINLEDSDKELNDKGLDYNDIYNSFHPVNIDENNGNTFENEKLIANKNEEPFRKRNNNENELPLQMGLLDPKKPKTFSKENTLGTNQDKMTGNKNDYKLSNVQRPDGRLALEALPVKNGEIKKNTKEIPKNRILHKDVPEKDLGDDKARKIQVIPMNRGEHVVDPKKYIPINVENDLEKEDDGLNTRYKSPKQIENKNLHKVGTYSGNKGFVLSQDDPQNSATCNGGSAGKNSQLNIDQDHAKEPLNVLNSNKNFGVQQFTENRETNINTNLFVDHKLDRRQEPAPGDCHTTTTPCATTTHCPTTTTPCPTTTTPCPTTTTPCPTTTTPCPTTTTPCPTTTHCPPTTTPCPTTTTPCTTPTTPCTTPTTPCTTPTTPCTTPPQACHGSTTTAKPCEGGRTPDLSSGVGSYLTGFIG